MLHVTEFMEFDVDDFDKQMHRGEACGHTTKSNR